MNGVKTKRQQGFTLMEVLVAFLILSIGLIGLAGLQLTGVKNGRDAYFRSQAIILGYDITDRMRANATAVEEGDYDLSTGSKAAGCHTKTSSDSCTTAELAADDVALWKEAVEDSLRLPAGDSIVCIDSSPDDGVSSTTHACDGSGNVYVSKVWWDDDRNPATAKERLITVFIP